MRILAVGASGYIASRAVPVLLDAGHEIVAGARSPEKLDRFWWREQVEVRRLDVLDGQSVAAAVTNDIDAILYLVHGLAEDDFAETDRKAATFVQQAADRVGIDRLVYVSGIIPDIPANKLSDHLKSRLEVEEILSGGQARAITLRAAMIVGAGSTSYALMSQLARRLPVTVLPDWMNHRVEPLAVIDLAHAIAGAITATAEGDSRHYDIGGGEQLRYPELISRYLATGNLERPAIQVPLVPQSIVAELASRIADVPGSTVRSLIESLREDMVSADRSWIGKLVPDEYSPIPLSESLQRCKGPVDYLTVPSRRDPLQQLPGDPRWAQ